MNKFPLLFVCAVLVTGCSSLRISGSELVGVWKSDAKRTLISMNSVEGLTDKAREIFENDFFGHLIVEYRAGDVRAYFDRSENNLDEMMEFRPYEVLKENEDVFVVRSYDLLEDEELTKTLYREGDCYYVLVSKWKFREYFCRTKL